MQPSLQTRFTFFMYRFHPSAYSPFRNPQSVSNFLVCPTCTFEFQRSIPTSLFPIWNANLSCAHDCILSCSPGDPINAELYNMRTRYMNEIIDMSMLTTGTKELKKKSRNIKDNKFLVCASEAMAHYLVTSGEDLLELKEYARTRII